MSTHLRGLGVSPGIAIGEPVVHETRPIATLRIPIASGEVEAEIERFQVAVSETVTRIRDHQERAVRQMGEEYAAIFEAHCLIASDPSLNGPVEQLIRDERVNAEWALDQVVERLVARFAALEDIHLSERRLDVIDVATQIMHALRGHDLHQLRELERPVILVADDLLPSQAVLLPLDKILGFALETGGPTAHTTIIARSFGIPVIVGAHGVCEAARLSRMVTIDGFEGKVVIDPNPAELAEYTSRQRDYQEQQAQLAQVRALPTVTRDGHRLFLLANIDLPAEVEQSLQWNVVGVGLYRSEFLYMRMSPAMPTESHHVEYYRTLVARMEGRPVTIRTYDLGGKKLGREMMGNVEANPVLGLRGIRLCLHKREFFRTQLRALLRVAVEFPEGVVRVMFPLISGIEEVRLARLLARQLADELRREGNDIPFLPPLGAMVEVPSAAIMAEQLAKEVDFLSIGTNDLIQYTLAVDRGNDLVADLYRPTSPAVLSLIADVIAAGDAAGVDVTMCGEMAADPLMVPVLVGLGLRRFSMNPLAVPVIRSLIRQLSYRETVHMAQQARQMVTARDIEEFLLEQLAISLAKTKIRV